jgi:hypothetical protein
MSNAKLLAGVVGGYVLGRTKKGKAAIQLAMWASGHQGVLGKLTSSEEAGKLLGQLQGPALEAIQQAAIKAATARMDQLSKGLADRTEALLSAGELTDGVGEQVNDGVSKAGSKTKAATKALSRSREDEEPDEDEDEAKEPEQPRRQSRRAPAKKQLARSGRRS